MEQYRNHSRSYQAGFSLVELMVGMTIGLLATLVIMQVMSGFEIQKRVTTGSADAQTNGSIALYDLGRELKMAGYGLLPVTDSALECTSTTIDSQAENATNRNSLKLSPVTIIDGNSDTIIIRSGNSPAGGIPTPIGAVGIPANNITLDTNLGCATGDRTLIMSKGGICAMSKANAVSTTVLTSITQQDTAGVTIGANLACLGNWSENSYAVSNGNLTLNGTTPVMEGIVNLQAQYGISATPGSNLIIQWVDATGIWDAGSITVANRNRIKAVRVAVVARNSKKEVNNVTEICDPAATPPTGLCSWDPTTSQLTNSPAPVIDLSFTDVDWQKYRYRVFDSIIPLQNMIWAGKSAKGLPGTLQ
jgi:type IV pilus assembly protein PilW